MQGKTGRLNSTVIISLTAYYFFSVVYYIYAQCYYSADGAYFFLRILETGNFLIFNSNRLAAEYVTQFLPVASIKIFHTKNYNILSYLYGVNLQLPRIIGLLICYSIAKNTSKNLMVFPFLSLFGLSMNASFTAIHHSHVISSVFWPILFYATLKDDYSQKDIFIFLSLVLIFMRSFESALFLGAILSSISIVKGLHETSKYRIFWFVMTALFIGSIIIAVVAIIHPFDPGNRTNFIISIFALYKHYPAVMSLMFISVISAFFFMPEFSIKYSSPITISLISIMLVVSIGPFVNPNFIDLQLHYTARILTTYVLPLLAVIYLMITSKRITVSHETWKHVWILIAVLIFGQISWQIIATSQWNGYRSVFKKELSEKRGFISLEDSLIGRNAVGNQLLKPMTWPWTTPTLSIIWAEKGNVSSIISNSSFYNGWQPFNPLLVESLPKIEQFGFSFNTFKGSIYDEKLYKFGTIINFSQQGNAHTFMSCGWANPESGHTWTSGNTASLLLITESPGHDPIIEMEVSPFVLPGKLPKQRFVILVNGEEVGRGKLTGPEKMHFTVPKGIWTKNKEIKIKFILPDAASPLSFGVNNDVRVIALGFKKIAIW